MKSSGGDNPIRHIRYKRSRDGTQGRGYRSVQRDDRERGPISTQLLDEYVEGVCGDAPAFGEVRNFDECNC